MFSIKKIAYTAFRGNSEEKTNVKSPRIQKENERFFKMPRN